MARQVPVVTGDDSASASGDRDVEDGVGGVEEGDGPKMEGEEEEVDGELAAEKHFWRLYMWI